MVTAKFDTPWRADSLLDQKNYRDVYIELNSASLPQSKTFVSDLGANGLRFKKDGSAYDTVDVGGKTYNFDGDWKKAKITEDDYVEDVFLIRPAIHADDPDAAGGAQEALVTGAPALLCEAPKRAALRGCPFCVWI